jgi:hypothetical protein
MNRNIIIIVLLLFIIIFAAATESYLFSENFASHDIPKVIYMCHKNIKDIEPYAENWKKLNPDYEIKLYDNESSKKMITDNYPPIYGDIFDYLKDGPIKADFWRICVLYLYGGVYADADIEPITPIDEFLEREADFVVVSAYDDHFHFNPNFLICRKEDQILKKCMEWYISKFDNKEPYDYLNWSIVDAFKDILFIKEFKKNYGLYKWDGPTTKTIQILQQVYNGRVDDYVIYNDKTLFKDRYANYDANSHTFKS